MLSAFVRRMLASEGKQEGLSRHRDGIYTHAVVKGWALVLRAAMGPEVTWGHVAVTTIHA